VIGKGCSSNVCCMHICKGNTKALAKQTAIYYEEIAYTNPGEMVSVDQLVSLAPGLVAQMTGKLMNNHYKYATVYVDHASWLGYVYLQKTAEAEETVKESKHSKHMLSHVE